MTLIPFAGAWAADSLYITDGGDDTVKRFNADTGAYQGTFVGPGSGGVNGPRGLIFTQGRLVVANQNVDQAFAGEILNYRQTNGGFLGALVPCNPPLGRSCDANAPFAPRGLIRGGDNTVYVADHDGGRVASYDSGSGAFLGNLDTTGFSGNFFPRGIVRGPDGLLYVSVTGLLAGDPLAGYVLRFNPRTGKFKDVFASHLAGGCAAFLHRPEGLVFGPDRRLYVTTFRADADDTDKVLILDGRTGACLDQIDLDQVGQPRSFAQSLLFGPKGRLFVPINNTGEVRRYNVKTKAYDVFVPAAAAGGPLLNPWFLSFGETDPRTLGYED
ncbi:MAG: hypothetical protein FIA97_11380 [Methylococcaceae bacterium]|nr:hypothetical protein [Methylococcaceae bacterium]